MVFLNEAIRLLYGDATLTVHFMKTSAYPMLKTAQAQCHCGKVQLTVTFPSRFCCHCYCESCRRSHAAGSVAWLGFRTEQVDITAGAKHIQAYQSSSGTLRKFCKICGTKISFESLRWAGETHIPLALFTTPVDREPEGNAFVKERPHWAPYVTFPSQ